MTTPSKVKTEVVCDNCTMVAYDEGIQDGAEQAVFMANMGAELDDHICEVVESPEFWSDGCACACQGGA